VAGAHRLRNRIPDIIASRAHPAPMMAILAGIMARCLLRRPRAGANCASRR
jgi:hypothetical protein